METLKETFCRNLRLWRDQRGLSQRQLSRRCNYDRTYIGKIERGEIDPSLEAMSRIAEALDVSLAEFFSRTDRVALSRVLGEQLPSTESLPAERPAGAGDPLRFLALFSRDGDLLAAADAFFEFASQPREQLVGEPFWELPFLAAARRGPDDFRELFLRARQGHRTLQLVTMGTAGGDEQPFAVHLEPVPDEEGSVESLVLEILRLIRATSP